MCIHAGIFPVYITIFTFLIHLLQRRWRVWGRVFEERGSGAGRHTIGGVSLAV